MLSKISALDRRRYLGAAQTFHCRALAPRLEIPRQRDVQIHRCGFCLLHHCHRVGRAVGCRMPGAATGAGIPRKRGRWIVWLNYAARLHMRLAKGLRGTVSRPTGAGGPGRHHFRFSGGEYVPSWLVQLRRSCKPSTGRIKGAPCGCAFCDQGLGIPGGLIGETLMTEFCFACSPDIPTGGTIPQIPVQHAAAGRCRWWWWLHRAAESPTLCWSGTPAYTQSLALTVYRPRCPPVAVAGGIDGHRLARHHQAAAHRAGTRWHHSCPLGARQIPHDYGSFAWAVSVHHRATNRTGMWLTVHASVQLKPDVPRMRPAPWLYLLINAKHPLPMASFTAHYMGAKQRWFKHHGQLQAARAYSCTSFIHRKNVPTQPSKPCARSVLRPAPRQRGLIQWRPIWPMDFYLTWCIP